MNHRDDEIATLRQRIAELEAAARMPPADSYGDNYWMLGITLLLFPILFTGSKISRWEGGLLIAAYAAYLGVLLNTAT